MLKGIRAQVIILSILPPSLVAICIGVFLNFSHASKVESFFKSQGKASVRQISNIAKYQIIDNRLDTLQSITNTSLEEDGLRSITIFNKDGKKIAHSGPRLRLIDELKANKNPEQGLTIVSGDQTFAFMLPIRKGETTTDGNLYDDDKKQRNFLGWVAIEYNVSQFKNLHDHETVQQNIILFLAFIISILFGYLFARRVTHDISNIKKSIKLYSEDNSPPVYSHYFIAEFNEISEALCNMAKIKKAEFDELRLNVELTSSDLQETIETIEVQNIELSIAQREAVQANKIKSGIFANTSHEMRTPLNGIIGFTRILKKTPLSSQQLEYLETIQVSSEGLLTIINDILDLSKIEANKLELENAPFNLRNTLEEVVSLLAPSAYEKHLEITLIIYQDVPLNLISDSTRIKQIFFNLISNAIKFTNKGEIIIRVELDNRLKNAVCLLCSTSDTGIGMTTSQQEDLFQAFYQASINTSREYGGTGLGLTIVKTLVELLNGKISVTSSPNEGTEFNFSMELGLQKHEDPIDVNTFNGFTVALVEPHQPTCMVMQHMLESLGLKVQLIASEEQIQESLSLFHIDCLLYGFSSACQVDQVTDKINRYTNQIHVPIIALTALSLEHLPVFQELNVVHCSKPVRKHILHKILTQALLPQTNPTLLPNQEVTADLSVNKNQLTALIVDDNPANLNLLGIILNDMAVNVVKAKDGLEAVSLANDNEFDVIFMDIQMPVLNGIQASEMIRLNSSVPIIVLTAHAMAEEKRQILSYGINDYLTKPINEEQIKAAINRFCQQPKEMISSPDNTHAVNLNLCLQLAKNRPVVANEIFSMLVSSLRSDIDHIHNLLLDQDIERLLEAVHKLHGATCYTGVEKLKRACYEMETALKQKDTDNYSICMDELIHCAEAVIHWHSQYVFKDELNKHMEVGTFS